jgi:hypothetical protein
MREGIREVLSVFTPEPDRRKGYATSLLRQVCEEADEAVKVLLLTVVDESLCAWYRRFGFKVIQGSPCLMARPPHLAQPMVTPLVSNPSLPPDLELAQRRIGDLRKAGVPLREAVRQALGGSLQ